MRVKELLERVRDGRASVEEGMGHLASLPYLDLGHSLVDTHRALRCGAPEVVFGTGKGRAELLDVARALLERHGRLLVTRLAPDDAAALSTALPGATLHARSRALSVGLPPADAGHGLVLVVAAGTADAPVAEEAELAARHLGARVRRLDDVGVAGIHRLLDRVELLRSANALVVVAGMEGALPSVVGGLVERPVIAVPTSVGYGTHLGGLTPLLAMLNSCAAGISVVNVDNGFGAGWSAGLINRLAPEVPRDGAGTRAVNGAARAGRNGGVAQE